MQKNNNQLNLIKEKFKIKLKNEHELDYLIGISNFRFIMIYENGQIDILDARD